MINAPKALKSAFPTTRPGWIKMGTHSPYYTNKCTVADTYLYPLLGRSFQYLLITNYQTGLSVPLGLDAYVLDVRAMTLEPILTTPELEALELVTGFPVNLCSPTQGDRAMIDEAHYKLIKPRVESMAPRHPSHPRANNFSWRYHYIQPRVIDPMRGLDNHYTYHMRGGGEGRPPMPLDAVRGKPGRPRKADRSHDVLARLHDPVELERRKRLAGWSE